MRKLRSRDNRTLLRTASATDWAIGVVCGMRVNADGSCRECDEILARGPVDALDGPPVVLEPPADMDFVRPYANYADVLEVPKMMHEAVGIQLVASLLNRNGVVIPLGGGVTYTLDV